MAEPVIGWGGSVAYTDGETPATIAKVLSVDAYKPENESIEFLALDSPDKVKEKCDGPTSLGEAKVEAVFDGATYAALDTLRADRTAMDWVFTFPGGETYSASCKVKSLETSMTPEDYLKMTINLDVWGEPEFDSEA